MIVCLLPYLTDLISQSVSFAKLSGSSAENFIFLLKSVGIGYICQFTSDICSDAGESAIASKIELAGRVELLLIALPLATEVVETAHTLAGV